MRRLLIISPDQIQRARLREVLSDYVATCLPSTSRAIRLLSGGYQCDGIVSDDLDGANELYDRLAFSRPELAHSLVLLVSSAGEAKQVPSQVPCLMKPINRDDLHAAVRWAVMGRAKRKSTLIPMKAEAQPYV